MQLACKHVLSSGGAMVPPLQIPASQLATANGSADSGVSGRESSQNGGHVQQPPVGWWEQTEDLDSWILQNLNDGPRRRRMVKILTEMAIGFQYPAYKVIKVLGDLNSENIR